MSYHATQGDIIWLTLLPCTGHEQTGRMPALVVSCDTFNRFSGKTAMVCPITSTDRGLPVQVKLDDRTVTTGVIMCDQAKILDLEARGADYVETVPHDILFDAVDIIAGIIGL